MADILSTKEESVSPTPVSADAPHDKKPASAVLAGDMADDIADTADDTTADDTNADEKTDDKDQDGNASSTSRKDGSPEQEYMTGLPFMITFGSLMLAALLSALNASMVSTVSKLFVFTRCSLMLTSTQATPSITNAFHSIQDVGWYSSSYLISK